MRLARLARIVSDHLDGRQTDDELRRRLVDLVDKRLINRYGMSHPVDRDRAAALMVPELAVLMTAESSRLTAEALNRIIDRIEEL